MKLRSVTVFHNHYDFEQDGVPANGYGGTVSFYMPTGGTVDVRLNGEQVQRLIASVSEDVAEAILSSVKGVSASAIISGAGSNILTHDREVL